MSPLNILQKAHIPIITASLKISIVGLKDTHTKRKITKKNMIEKLVLISTNEITYCFKLSIVGIENKETNLVLSMYNSNNRIIKVRLNMPKKYGSLSIHFTFNITGSWSNVGHMFL